MLGVRRSINQRCRSQLICQVHAADELHIFIERALQIKRIVPLPEADANERGAAAPGVLDADDVVPRTVNYAVDKVKNVLSWFDR